MNNAPGKHFALLLLCGWLAGCAESGWTPEFAFPLLDTPPPDEEIETGTASAAVRTHGFYLDKADSVVGRLARVSVREGDTLLDLARHFGLGYQHIVDANPELDPWIPLPSQQALLPLQFILPEAPRSGVVINLAAMRLFYFPSGKQATLATWPIGIGREGRATPLGTMSVERKTEHPTWYVPESIRKTHAEQGDPLPNVVPPGPDNPLGDYALYLSRPSYLIHGTNKPFSIGLRASNGCIRLYPEDIAQAFRSIPLKTPVLVVNQPYLLGWLDGKLYLEAHPPFEEIDLKQAKNNLLAKLRQINQKHPYPLDWPKIEQTLKQARGIPVPIFAGSPRMTEAVDVEHPERLNGQPSSEVPAQGGWLLRTAETKDGFWVRRLTAQLNHLGPRIPARAVTANRHYRLVAGPFMEEKDARKAQAALAEDFFAQTELVKIVRNSGRK